MASTEGYILRLYSANSAADCGLTVKRSSPEMEPGSMPGWSLNTFIPMYLFAVWGLCMFVIDL